MADPADTTGDAREPDGKFTDEEFKDGSHTSDRAGGHGDEGEYTDSEGPKAEKPHIHHHD